MGCPCEGKRGLELVSCLAPPAGEYETQVSLSSSLVLVASRSGVVIRRIVTDDTLPFVRTIDRPVTREDTLKAYGIELDDILCRNIEGLEAAATHGSRVARSLINECWSLIEEYRKKCGARST